MLPSMLRLNSTCKNPSLHPSIHLSIQYRCSLVGAWGAGASLSCVLLEKKKVTSCSQKSKFEQIQQGTQQPFSSKWQTNLQPSQRGQTCKLQTEKSELKFSFILTHSRLEPTTSLNYFLDILATLLEAF